MPIVRRKKLPLINYTSRDFESIKRDLNDYRRRYYPTVSRDENEAAFDELMLDTVSYVGDILSFYLDYSVNESFLDTAVEYNNVLKLGKQLGYKFRGNPSSLGFGTMFAILPANSTGLGPDPRYLFKMKKNSQFSSTSGNGFLLNEDVSFANPNNQIVVARVDQTTGIPTAYAIKAKGQIISGKLVQEVISIGAFQKFLKVQLSGRDIAEIISVVDDQGNEYFEVDYLSQDTVYKAISNRDTTTNATVPSLLKPFVVPRRFIVDRDRVNTFLQFGFGSDKDNTSDPLIDPVQAVLQIYGKNYVADATFDPTNLLGTNKLGIAPANTNLTVVYRVNTSDNVNASRDSVTEIVNPIVEFSNIASLDATVVRSIVNSIEVTNENPIIGDVSLPSVDELKHRVFDNFSSQNRAVTALDYKALAYRMPPSFGAIKRVNLVQDPHSFKRHLKMFVTSENSDGTLTPANSIIKENLRVWINQGRMVNDSIDILDAKIVNIGIQFVAVGEGETNRFEILNNATLAFRDAFLKKEDIGSPFFITKIHNTLRGVEGIVDVVKVKVFQKVGGQYSTIKFDIDQAISADGRFIDVPDNVILEIKFPETDIIGAVK